jgi:outer membrane protein assembly factor BamB
VDDGSVLWEMPVNEIHHSPPVIADLNNDGGLDLVFATQRQRKAEDPAAKIFALNGSDGAVIWQKPFRQGGLGMTIADVNADNRMEVIINDYASPRSLYLLNGQDGSTIWQRETIGSQYGQPTAADLDGDGMLEIISHHHDYEWPRAVERLIVWDHEGNELWSFESTPTDAQAANAPEVLGRTPCESWESTTVADFNADGNLEIGFGSRCSYYLLDTSGNVIWSTVLEVEGWGTFICKMEDGSECDPSATWAKQTVHGTGGFYWDSTVGNIDDDPALEIVFAHWPEWLADQFWPSGQFVYKRITPSNEVWALDGADGSVQWVFEGAYISELNNLQKMWTPILVDLTGDGQLDVLALSEDRNLYVLNGATGEKMLEYFSYLPPQDEARHLTFVPEGDLGVVVYSAHRQGRIYVLKALVIAERISE